MSEQSSSPPHLQNFWTACMVYYLFCQLTSFECSGGFLHSSLYSSWHPSNCWLSTYGCNQVLVLLHSILSDVFNTNCQVPTSSFGRFGQTRGGWKFWRRGQSGGEWKVEGEEEGGEGGGGGGGEDAGEEEQYDWIGSKSPHAMQLWNSSKCVSPFQMVSTHTSKDEYRLIGNLQGRKRNLNG